MALGPSPIRPDAPAATASPPAPARRRSAPAWVQPPAANSGRPLTPRTAQRRWNPGSRANLLQRALQRTAFGVELACVIEVTSRLVLAPHHPQHLAEVAGDVRVFLRGVCPAQLVQGFG